MKKGIAVTAAIVAALGLGGCAGQQAEVISGGVTEVMEELL